MDTITVNVSELYERVSELKADGMEYVRVYILEALEDDDGSLPPSLNFSAWKKDSFAVVDYDEIDECEQ